MRLATPTPALTHALRKNVADVHKNMAKELGEELMAIPAHSSKICTRLGLPICAQLRSMGTPKDEAARAEPPAEPPAEKA